MVWSMAAEMTKKLRLSNVRHDTEDSGLLFKGY